MNLAQLLPIVLQVSIGLVVFCLALSAEPGDLAYLLRRPGLLVRSVLSMNVVMPLLAVALSLLFKLRLQVEVALVLLAVSPVPPVLPGKQSKAGGNVSYAIGLLMFASLLSIVVVPLSVTLIARVFGAEARIPMALVAKVVGGSVIAPLVLGTVVRMIAPGFAARFAGPGSKIGMLLLVVAFLPVLLKIWPAIAAQVGDFTLLAIVLFTVVGVAVGHVLGGPVEGDRTVLALATASRHPGVALALAGAVTTAENTPVLSAAIFLAFRTSAIVTLPYVKWRKRTAAATVLACSGSGWSRSPRTWSASSTRWRCCSSWWGRSRRSSRHCGDLQAALGTRAPAALMTTAAG
jgi:BASS family bile acid:Na+ symporter